MGGRAAVPGSAIRSSHWAGGDAMARETVKAGGALRLLNGRLVRRATVWLFDNRPKRLAEVFNVTICDHGLCWNAAAASSLSKNHNEKIISLHLIELLVCF